MRADEAERRYEPGQLQSRRRGAVGLRWVIPRRRVESVRLDPALRAAAAQRAADDGITVSEVIRNALAEYLRSA